MFTAAVRTQSANISDVSCRHLTAEAWDRTQASPCDICGGTWHWDMFFSGTSVFPFQYQSTNVSYSLYLYVALTRTNGRSVETLQKAMLFRKSSSIGQKRTSSFVPVFTSWYGILPLQDAVAYHPVSSKTLHFNPSSRWQ